MRETAIMESSDKCHEIQWKNTEFNQIFQIGLAQFMTNVITYKLT